ncbi:acylneuraminate cytidylyltransferase family protein [Laribacter hongkongensis]|uniref:acylneuraminate cytidylyltransferase family protein n=1 Tax=Laribacter hongkongensis TaxID=168471 RepID=UPI0022B29B86|nr:hypothetical protein [Laribacter hongkongensis]MCG9040717.1 hypothetical protein [Laribacter hongkongensis]MCG9067873.1 hypothetical protein [Laribacter hongkongensis]MCG9109477.1 hypothetical protein [Laribacter hongkongensis]
MPARGGSKRIPRKNIKPFHGKPMVGYTIGAAIGSEVFDRMIVSTEDEEIARVAREHGAEVSFVRLAELADDHTPTASTPFNTGRACVQWRRNCTARPSSG